MTTSTSVQTVDTSAHTGRERILSIDILRGLTMMVMIFVNELSEVHGLPWWTYHMPARVNAMTYVDMVFPCFLFIVGMSLPLSVKQRLKRKQSLGSLWLHVALRAIALIILGLILANADKGDRSRMGMSTNVWALVALLGAFLLWGTYGVTSRKILLSLRISGAVLIVAMFLIFRRLTPDGHLAWIDASYPEILGLIGFTHMAVCLLFIPTRRWTWAPTAWFGILVVFNAFCAAKWIEFPASIPLYVWPFGNGAMPSIVMAGVVTSSIFLSDHRWKSPAKRVQLAITFAVVALLLGRLLTPLGISKIRATPTWCLYSIAASILLFAALYWICDVKGHIRWASFVRPAGSNTLLTYLLPDIYYFLAPLLGVAYFLGHWNAGLPGVLKSVVFTLLILALAWLLTRWKLRMQI
jgi:heparan-alpha-glucosaminide N-acetyltransferase